MVVFAGVVKSLSLTEFEASLRQWNSIPIEIVPLLIIAIPLAEVVTGAMVLAVPRKVFSCFCLLVLLLAITAAVVVESLVGGEVSCNCFGPVGTRVELGTSSIIARNSVLIAIVAWSILGSLKEGSVCHEEIAT